MEREPRMVPAHRRAGFAGRPAHPPVYGWDLTEDLPQATPGSPTGIVAAGVKPAAKAPLLGLECRVCRQRKEKAAGRFTQPPKSRSALVRYRRGVAALGLSDVGALLDPGSDRSRPARIADQPVDHLSALEKAQGRDAHDAVPDR